MKSMGDFSAAVPWARRVAPSFPLFTYQLAHFGWGRGLGRLTAFVVALVAGVVFGVRNAEWRRQTLLQVGLIVLPIALYLAIGKRTFFPRYWSMSYLPVIMLAGLGIHCLSSALIGKLRLSPTGRVLMAGGLVACLLAWHVGPYTVLYTMRDKRMPFSNLRDWLRQNAPNGGLFVWHNGNHMREVPGMYPVAGRHAAFADFSVMVMDGGRQELTKWRSQNARTFFARFPRSVLVVEADFKDVRGFWPWILTDFAKREFIGGYDFTNLLWQWGFGPHNMRHHHVRNFFVYYNTAEDIHRMRRSSGKVAVWPRDGGWGYVQTREGWLFVTPQQGAEFEVVKYSGAARAYELSIRGVALAPGILTACLARDGKTSKPVHARFGKGNGIEVRMGPFSLVPGESCIAVSQLPADRRALLIHSFGLSPAG